MEFVNANERGKVMSSNSQSSIGRRKRRTLRIAAATALLALAGALLPGVANAYNSWNWPDSTVTLGWAHCTPITPNYPVPRTWQLGASQSGLGSPFGAGYDAAYVMFRIYDVGRGRYVFADSSWTKIPQVLGGLSAYGGWRFGSGTFAVYAAFAHRGAVTPWLRVGWMRWLNGLCFNS